MLHWKVPLGRRSEFFGREKTGQGVNDTRGQGQLLARGKVASFLRRLGHYVDVFHWKLPSYRSLIYASLAQAPFPVKGRPSPDRVTMLPAAPGKCYTFQMNPGAGK
jgi:hypothetical protein